MAGLPFRITLAARSLRAFLPRISIMTDKTPAPMAFSSLGLPPFLLQSLSDLGYEEATPIQAETIPALMANKDVVGIAQTGTGKTAAFALPALAQLDYKKRNPQVLVLCPTRELSMQVADAFRSYAKSSDGCRVVALCGGNDMRQQLRSLKDGVHIVVATPGRLLDHLKRGSADFSEIKSVVLDEADEMLRMGFIDDVDEILAQTPKGRRVALFSATMPQRIREIASEHLVDPVEVAITSAATTNVNIQQCYWLVKGTNKLDALTRFLSAEDTQGVIVFVRTRESTSAIAEQLRQRGFNASPLNGDIDQKTRFKTVEQLKDARLDVVVATDVAARGLDVERITHVINYDIPFDRESYVHRIGRTGRAGREGKAILFVAPRERRMLHNIERVTKQKIQPIDLPTFDDIDAKARERLMAQLRLGLEAQHHPRANDAIEQLINEGNTHRDIALALASMIIDGSEPARETRSAKTSSGGDAARPKKTHDPLPLRDKRGNEREVPLTYTAKELGRARPLDEHPDVVMERFWLAVGRKQGVKAREIVGAIANEAGIEGQFIGSINIFEHYATIDLPEGMPKPILKHLKKTRVKGANLGMVRVVDSHSS